MSRRKQAPLVPRLERDAVGRLPLEALVARCAERTRSLRREYVSLMTLSAACRVVGSPLRRRRFTARASRIAGEYVIAAHREARHREALADIGAEARLQYDYVQMIKSTSCDSSQARWENDTYGHNQYTTESLLPEHHLRKRPGIERKSYDNWKRSVARARAAGHTEPDVSTDFSYEEALAVVAQAILERRQERAALLQELADTPTKPDPQLRQRVKTLEDELDDLAALAPGERVSKDHWATHRKGRA